MPIPIGVNFLGLVSGSFLQAHRDIRSSRDTDPSSPTYGQKLREFFFRGGRGCVDGDTLLETPSGKVKVRDFKGGLVYAFDGSGIVEADACRAVKFKEEDLYEVKFANSLSIVCTDQHRFFTRRGWVELKDITAQDELLVFLPSASLSSEHDSQGLSKELLSCRQSSLADASSSSRFEGLARRISRQRPSVRDLQLKRDDEFRSMLPEDALRSTRTLLSFLYRYWNDSRPCDGRLLREEDTYRDVLLRLIGVLEHNRDSSHADDLGRGGRCNHCERYERPLSKQDCLNLRADKCCADAGIQISQKLSEWLSEIYSESWLSRTSDSRFDTVQSICRILLCSTDAYARRVDGNVSPKTSPECEILQMLSDMLRHSVRDESFSDSFEMDDDVLSRALPYGDNLQFAKIASVTWIKKEEYYDIFVPFYNNYIANGIVNHNSTKSSFISLEIVQHLVEFPKSNAIVFVRVAENIRDSVYKQILWAIDHLELNAFFKCTTSPFRCVYLPTGQEILFRGLDKAGKIKGIKPSVGYFDMIWFEELTEFNGMEDCRSVIQSALRGGDEDDDSIGDNVQTWEFYSYNPPPTIANWVNVEANKVIPGRKVYESTYLTVNPRWLGRNFFERAEILRQTNPRAYAHEYLGWVTGTGGNIFNNLEIRNITDEEIFTKFDNRCFGIDWGFANDPFVWLAMNFDRNHQTLYIFDEIVALGKRTQETAALVKKKMERVGANCTVFADCAEPDSIADFNAWGVRCEGCPKPHGTKWSGRDYEFKALQDLRKIVIDKTYCPKTAEEFQKLEYPKNPHGEFRSEYPHSDPGDACTRWNTEIITRHGRLKIGDLAGCRAIEVLSYDELGGSFEFTEGVFVRKTRDNAEMVRVELEDGRFVECTQDHRILTENRGWVEAGNLTESDFIVCEG